MRRIYLAILALITIGTFSSSLFAQKVFTGKPRYNIRVTQHSKTLGNIVVELFPSIAPMTVENFDSLVSIKFFDSLMFHRVKPGFVIQGGDPNTRSGDSSTWGVGDASQQTIDAEFNSVSHQPGVLSMARLGTDINSATSQFFICLAPEPHLDSNYTAFGQVVSGMNIVDSIGVTPTNAADQPIDTVRMFITALGENDSTAAAVSLKSPADGTTEVPPGQIMKWDLNRDGMEYQIDYATDNTFSNLIVQHGASQVYGMDTLRGQIYQSDLWWRVRANNGAQWGPYSQAWHFTVAGASPVLQVPANASKGVSTVPTFQWQAAPGADSYLLEVSRSNTFVKSSLTINRDTIKANSFTALAPLNVNTKYYWRVQGIAGGVHGFASPVWSMTTSATGGVAIPHANADMTCYPNPSSGEVTIRYSLSATSPVTLSIVDALGREVLKPIDNLFQADGTHEWNISTKGLGKGEYFYRMQTAEGIRTAPMVIQ